MKATPAEIQEYLNLLGKTLHRVGMVTKNVDEFQLQGRSDENEWSVNDILAHLRSCADVWGGSVEKMLAEDRPTVPYHHPRQWIKKTNYLELPFHESFQAFKLQRNKLLKVLEKLSFEDWSRAATIQRREHTVFTQVRRMAQHENEHCGQIEELLK